MRKEVEIKTKKMEMVLKKQDDFYKLCVFLENSSNEYDYIEFDTHGERFSRFYEHACTLLGVKDEDYDTLDKAIALWGLEDPRKPKTVWDLKNGDRYWIVGNSGYLLNILWYNHTCDIKRRKAGNCFLSEEDGLKKIEKDEAKVSLLKIISDYNNGWVPDWSDHEQAKFYFYLDWKYTHMDSQPYKAGVFTLGCKYNWQIFENEFYIKDSNIPLTDEVKNLLSVIYDTKN